MRASIFFPSVVGAAVVGAQNSANACTDGFQPGTDEVIFTIPYTYPQVMSIVGSFKNLTWSGSPDGTVTLNGTDNTVGTARTYGTAGAHVVETILAYSKPANGPYYEDHYLDLISVSSANVSLYASMDATTITPICNGAASTFNFTAVFCANNVTVAAVVLHMAHLQDVQTVGVFLGGQNFSSCAVLVGSNATTTSSPPIATASAATANVASISTLIMLGGLLAWAM